MTYGKYEIREGMRPRIRSLAFICLPLLVPTSGKLAVGAPLGIVQYGSFAVLGFFVVLLLMPRSLIATLDSEGVSTKSGRKLRWSDLERVEVGPSRNFSLPYRIIWGSNLMISFRPKSDTAGASPPLSGINGRMWGPFPVIAAFMVANPLDEILDVCRTLSDACIVDQRRSE